MAADNGRTREFIRRKDYKDKSRCYECGQSGHLSYTCPHNILGDREQPKTKQKQKRQKPKSKPTEDDVEQYEEEDDELSLHDAIMMSHHMREAEEMKSITTSSTAAAANAMNKRKPIKPDSYFSDEDAYSD